MNAKERLQKVQATLVERGVKDVKFFVNLGTETSVSALANDVADVLEAVVRGDARAINSFAELNAA